MGICSVRWPRVGKVNGAKTGEPRVIFHCCAKPTAHPDAHECQCSFNRRNSAAPQFKEREWVAR